MIEIYTDPIAKPRMTQRDRWAQRPCVVHYRRYCDVLREECEREGWTLPDSVAITFVIEMPRSWSKKKRLAMQAEHHSGKPDIDNLIKGVLDALRPEDDSGVWRVSAVKRWGKCGCVILQEWT
jgi:Holliday junction resolvase RusA-like endonuclease